MHSSTLRLQGTGGTGRIFDVQVWDLKKAGPKLAHLAVQNFVQFCRSRVNARWNRASFCSCKNLSGTVRVNGASDIVAFFPLLLPPAGRFYQFSVSVKVCIRGPTKKLSKQNIWNRHYRFEEICIFDTLIEISKGRKVLKLIIYTVYIGNARSTQLHVSSCCTVKILGYTSFSLAQNEIGSIITCLNKNIQLLGNRAENALDVFEKNRYIGKE